MMIVAGTIGVEMTAGRMIAVEMTAAGMIAVEMTAVEMTAAGMIAVEMTGVRMTGVEMIVAGTIGVKTTGVGMTGVTDGRVAGRRATGTSDAVLIARTDSARARAPKLPRMIGSPAVWSVRRRTNPTSPRISICVSSRAG
ncbi:hypothetical protein CGZ98_01605 [Enemella evansiae]|uniref:hypothetical protein n=1 Tax=Enemella evansiae TaxID=2016499 RepID=UPI000B971ED7|nr:hypothetical protein [Enemella evansiae]OYO15162.1 hypothetical protein CGZ98_01605 [Enemella evansiae]